MVDHIAWARACLLVRRRARVLPLKLSSGCGAPRRWRDGALAAGFVALGCAGLASLIGAGGDRGEQEQGCGSHVR